MYRRYNISFSNEPKYNYGYGIQEYPNRQETFRQAHVKKKKGKGYSTGCEEGTWKLMWIS